MALRQPPARVSNLPVCAGLSKKASCLSAGTMLALVTTLAVLTVTAKASAVFGNSIVRGETTKGVAINGAGLMAMEAKQHSHDKVKVHAEAGVAGPNTPYMLKGSSWDDLNRDFVGASPEVSQTVCTEDAYTPSEFEQQWSTNVLSWTADHCSHMTKTDADTWINGNTKGPFDPKMFSKVCRKGKVPQFIEPIAGICRDPRVGCNDDPAWKREMSVDWLVFPSKKAQTTGAKSRFYDAGGSQFMDAMNFFLATYKAHGIVFDEVYAWEFRKQGVESYWQGADAETRAFWEPRLTFYDGIGVSADKDSEHNPVSRIFKSCKPEDFCSIKIDIDTPSIELPLVQQFLNTPDETSAKLDEFFFEHHVHGVMQGHGWGQKVAGTFADSYKIFSDLRKLGVRAHSWV